MATKQSPKKKIVKGTKKQSPEMPCTPIYFN